MSANRFYFPMKITNQKITELSRKLGFDLIGFTKAEMLGKEIDNLKTWLGKKYQAGIKYMENNVEKRANIPAN